jgi:hypothetical protein
MKVGGKVAIIGYEFLVETDSREQEWTQIKAPGGMCGDGSLYIKDKDVLPRVRRRLLAKARLFAERGELAQDGILSVLDIRPIDDGF